MKSRPRGLYAHIVFNFPGRPWLEIAVGVRHRRELTTHHIEFPWPKWEDTRYLP